MTFNAVVGVYRHQSQLAGSTSHFSGMPAELSFRQIVPGKQGNGDVGDFHGGCSSG